jgi:putative FmdB family regulatory protein
MPTYDYRCKACNHEFEEFQSMTAPVLKKCPKCGKATLERLIGIGAAVVFKGSGFYQTDYRSESYRKAADADKPATDAKAADSKTDAKSETKAEAKPDTKAETKAESKSEASTGAKSSAAAKIEPKPASSRPATSKSASKSAAKSSSKASSKSRSSKK